MKLNLSRLILAAGLSIGIISFTSVAEAGIELNGKSLKGQSSKQPQQLKIIRMNNQRLTGQSESESQLQQQSKKLTGNTSSLAGQVPQSATKKLSQNASSLTGKTTEPKPVQGNKGIETSP